MESEQRMGTAYRRASSKFSNRPGEICRDSYMGLLYWSHEPGATRSNEHMTESEEKSITNSTKRAEHNTIRIGTINTKRNCARSTHVRSAEVVTQ